MKVEALKDGDLLAETHVEATNWMSALRAARAELGEEGGVPPGASCAVAANGEVTILDSVERRRLVLTPAGAKKSDEPPKVPSGRVKGAKSFGPKHTDPQSPQPTASKPVSPEPATPEKTAAAAVSSGAKSKEAPKMPRKRPRTAAYDVSAFTMPKKRAATAKAGEGETTETTDAPPAKASATSSAPTSAESPSTAATKAALRVMHQRDVEPSADNPITYRERAFFSGAAADGHVVAALRDELATLRQTDDVKGLYVNLAAFDHEWTERPERPPVATLEFRAWKGEPIVGTPLAASGLVPHSAAASQPVQTPATTPEPTKPALAEPTAESAEPAAESTKPEPVVEAPKVVEPAPPAVEVVAPAVEQAPNEQLAQEASVASQTPMQTGRSLSDDFEMDDPQFAAVAEKEHGIAAAFEACEDLHFLETPLDGIRFAERLLLELVDAEAFTGGLYDINASVYRIVSAVGPGAEARRGTQIPQGKGVFGRVSLDTGVLITDSSDARFDDTFDGRAGAVHNNALTAPVAHGQRMYAVVQLMNAKSGAFTEEDESIVGYVAQQLGRFLHDRHMRNSLIPK